MRALQAVQRVVSSVSPAQPTTGLLGTTVGKWRGFFESSTAFEAEPAKVEQYLKEAQSQQPSVYVDLETDYDRDDPEAVDQAQLWARAKPTEVPNVDLGLELDHAVDPDVVDKAQLWATAKPTEVPKVDLDYELDYDDPEAVDKEELWRVRPREPLQNVNLDDEMDLIHEKEQQAA